MKYAQESCSIILCDNRKLRSLEIYLAFGLLSVGNINTGIHFPLQLQ